MPEITREFFNYLEKELGFSNKTVVSYNYELQIFFEFVNLKKINYIKVRKEEIRNYLRYLDDLKYKNSTIAANLSALRSFYGYLVMIKKIESNPFKRISNPKIEKKLPNFLNQLEIEDLLEFYSFISTI